MESSREGKSSETVLITRISPNSITFLHIFQCDILVSELLGSFGDNELSPECLDGAQKFLKRK